MLRIATKTRVRESNKAARRARIAGTRIKA
jgi:hypothetical protein